MKKTILSLLLFTATCSVFAQKYLTRTGEISFHSDAPLEKIEAKNKQVATILNTETGELAFKVLIKSFEFEKALMQEHFNENYLESDQFPNASYEGKITNLDAVDFASAGTYDAQTNGKLTIHGVTQEVTETGKVKVSNDGKIELMSTFNIKLSDYGIKNDKVKNISEDIEIRVNSSLSKMK